MDCIDPRQLHWFDVMISNDNPLAISKNWMKNTWTFQPACHVNRKSSQQTDQLSISLSMRISSHNHHLPCLTVYVYIIILEQIEYG